MNTSTQHNVAYVESEQYSADADFILTGFFILLIIAMILGILKVSPIRAIKNLFKK